MDAWKRAFGCEQAAMVIEASSRHNEACSCQLRVICGNYERTQEGIIVRSVVCSGMHHPQTNKRGERATYIERRGEQKRDKRETSKDREEVVETAHVLAEGERSTVVCILRLHLCHIDCPPHEVVLLQDADGLQHGLVALVPVEPPYLRESGRGVGREVRR